MWLMLGLVCAWSQEGEAPAETDESNNTVIVYQPDGTPRVAGSAHFVDEKELETHEYNDIGRILSQTPGLYIRGEDGFGLRPNIGLRGANSDRSSKVTLLEDGVPLVPAAYAAPAAYYFPMATRLTGVEVFKGAAAIQHGPQTIGGAVNVLTRAVPRKSAGAIDVGFGQRNTAKLHGWAALADERKGVLLEAAHLQTDGFKRLDTGGDTGFERTDLLLKGRLSSAATAPVFQEAVLKLGYGAEQSRETYLGLHPDDYAIDPYRRYASSENGLMRWRRTQAELFWTVRTKNLRVRTVAYHHWLSRQWTRFSRFASGPDAHALLQQPPGGTAAIFLGILRGEIDSDTPDQLLQIGTNDRRFQSFGVQSTARWSVPGKKVSNRLEVGVRVHGDRVERIGTEALHAMKSGTLERTADPETKPVHNRSSATAVAAHMQNDLRLQGLHLLPGARLELVRTTYVDVEGGEPRQAFRSTLLPGFAVLQEVGEPLQLFGGVHRGFSPVSPGADERARPEVSWNLEAGARLGSAQGQLEVVGYLNDYRNLTGQCTISGGCRDDQLDQQFSAGKVWVGGAEVAARWTVLLPGKLELTPSATYTLTWSRFRSDINSPFPQFGQIFEGDQLPYVPMHQGSAKLSIEHPRFGFSAGLAARTGMRDRAGSGPLKDTDVPGRALLDLAAHVKVDRHLKIYATVVNATGSKALESQRPFGARPTAPFQAMVGIKLQ